MKVEPEGKGEGLATERCSRCSGAMILMQAPPVEYGLGKLARWVRCLQCGHVRLMLAPGDDS